MRIACLLSFIFGVFSGYLLSAFAAKAIQRQTQAIMLHVSSEIDELRRRLFLKIETEAPKNSTNHVTSPHTDEDFPGA
jgi:uncharacterized membrane-anchored protein YhcB (DUF1043 family)